MADEKSLFERLDSIETNQIVNNQALLELLNVLKETKNIKDKNPQQQAKSEQEILTTFLTQSKKSWRWFGSLLDFRKNKTLSMISQILLLALGIVSTVITSISCGIYSTFSLFENIWLMFGIMFLLYTNRAKITYEMGILANNSSIKYQKDNIGAYLPRKEKTVFRVFRWLAIIAVVANIIFILTRTNNLSAIAIILEVLFLGAVIFSSFMNFHLFSQYSIVWAEGRNLTTKEKVVLVFSPISKQFMTESDFKNKMPVLFE